MPEPSKPRDPNEILAERIGEQRRNVRDALEKAHGYVDGAVAAAVDAAFGKLVKACEDYQFLKRTLRSDPPDRDRAPTPVRPRSDPSESRRVLDQRREWEASEEDKTPVAGPGARRRRS